MRASVTLVIGLCSASWACSGPAPAGEESGPVEVVALSEVAHWAARSVLREEGVELRLLPPRGVDPSAWQPTGSEVAEAAQADLIVANGAGYEAWMKTAALPAGRLAFLTDGVLLLERGSEVHSHGKQGAHSHGAVDPHTWTDLASLADQLEGLAAELERMRPGLVDPVALEGVTAELRQLDVEWAAALAPLQGVSVGASGPTFAYLARRYGLTLVELDLAADRAPSGSQLTAAQTWAEAQPVDLLWWESPASSEALGPLGDGVHHVVLDPLETGPGGLELVVQARANLEVFQQSARVLAESEPRP